jgi:hypothetical protein
MCPKHVSCPSTYKRKKVSIRTISEDFERPASVSVGNLRRTRRPLHSVVGQNKKEVSSPDKEMHNLLTFWYRAVTWQFALLPSSITCLVHAEDWRKIYCLGMVNESNRTSILNNQIIFDLLLQASASKLSSTLILVQKTCFKYTKIEPVANIKSQSRTLHHLEKCSISS